MSIARNLSWLAILGTLTLMGLVAHVCGAYDLLDEQNAASNGFRPVVYACEDVGNLRDCGGWMTTQGLHVRTNRLFRSRELNHLRANKPKRVFTLSAARREFFRTRLGIRTDIDLRNAEECKGMTASPLGADVTWAHIPAESYRNVDTPEGREAFKAVFQKLLDESTYPALIHCRAGRDRTGCVVYLLNAILGVNAQDLRFDWEFTERQKGNHDFDYGKINGLLSVLNKYPGDTIQAKAEAFVLSLGFTTDDLARFRHLMLE